LAAEALFTRFHRTAARRQGHGTQHNAALAFFAEIRADAEGVIYMPILAPTNEASGRGLPDLVAHTHTTPAQNAVLIPKRVSDFRDSTTHGDVLDSARVWSLGYQQFRDVVT
jgi:hypothetical protein